MRKTLLSLLLVLLNISCSDKLEKDTIKVGYLPIIAQFPAYLLNEEHPEINVEYIVYSSSNDIMSALNKGDIDIATTIAIAPIAQYALSLIQNGEKINYRLFSVSKTTMESGFDAVYAKKGNSSIDSLKDIKGKKVGVFPGSTAKNILSYYLSQKYNISGDSIKWNYIPPGMQITALNDGDIDILYTYEPNCTISKLNSHKQIYGSIISSVLEGAPYGGSAINKKFEMEYPKLAKQFISAFDEAITKINNNDTIYRYLLQKKLGLSEDISKNCHLEIRIISKEMMNKDNVDRFQKFLNILTDMNELPSYLDVKKLL